MADYNKQTVAQLRQLLKDRGIPSTGLTRKAQIVEKLEEADKIEGGDAPVEDEAQNEEPFEEPNDDAPPEQDAQVEQKKPEDAPENKEDVPGPPLSEAGEPAAQPIVASEPEPVAVATIDGNRETISHIDNDVPPPDQAQALERPAEDTTMDNEPGTIQPAGVFSAAPTDPEDVVGPKITEPADGEMEVDNSEDLANDELPDAPGPAAEALRFARQEQEDPKNEANTEVEDETATPVTIEESSLEKVDLLTIPEHSTAQTSRLGTEEWESDTKKRKRRSGSPELPYQDVKAKKLRPSQVPAPEVYLKEDTDVVMEPANPEAENDTPDKPLRAAKIDRYQTLSALTTTQPAFSDDRPVSPALHPATSALYIRNFMRPLRPEALRTHLVSLASPASPDRSIISSLFLDALKTHALVLFTSTAAASRVRAALHGAIWPPEGNRKELWVDYVPEGEVDAWTEMEEEAVRDEKEGRVNGRPVAAKRFEVVYPGNDAAVFQEVGAATQAPVDAPRGPKAHSQLQSQPPLEPTARRDIAAPFQTLDQLFSSTTAKPSLYFLPVSDDIAEIRLKELGVETSRDWAPGEVRKGRGIRQEVKYRYCFDGEGRVVEGGEDRGAWADGGGGGFRGRGKGGGGGRGRGGWRG